MSDPLIRALDHYVILEPSENEKFLNQMETLNWLESWLKRMDELPLDIKDKPSLKEAARHLLDTSCALDINPGFQIQWFAVRLEPQDR